MGIMKNLIMGLFIFGIAMLLLSFLTTTLKATAVLISFISLISALVIAMFRYFKKKKVISGN